MSVGGTPRPGVAVLRSTTKEARHAATGTSDCHGLHRGPGVRHAASVGQFASHGRRIRSGNPQPAGGDTLSAGPTPALAGAHATAMNGASLTSSLRKGG